MNPSHSERHDDADIAQAEASRVATVRSAIQGDRIESMEREARIMRSIIAQLRRTTADAREAGRSEALEIISRLDPVRLMALLVSKEEGDDGVAHKWSKEGLANLLGVGSDNPMSRVLESLETGYWDCASRLMDANLRIRDLQRQLEIAQSPRHQAEPMPVCTNSQRLPSDPIRKRMQTR